MRPSIVASAVVSLVCLLSPLKSFSAPLNLYCDLRPLNSVVYRVDWERGTIDGQTADLTNDAIVSRTTLGNGEFIVTVIQRGSLRLRIDSSSIGLIATGNCSMSNTDPQASKIQQPAGQVAPSANQATESRSQRMELMQEKQIAMQELQIELTNQQNLVQQDQAAQQRQRQLANSPSGGSLTAQVLVLQEKQSLIANRQSTGEAYRVSIKREAQIRDQIGSLDARINAMK